MKKFAALLLSVILVAGVFTGVTLVNAESEESYFESFEEWKEGYTFPQTATIKGDLGLFWATDNDSFTVSTEQVKNGSKAGKIVSGAKYKDTGAWLTNSLIKRVVTQNETYELSFWYYSTAATKLYVCYRSGTNNKFASGWWADIKANIEVKAKEWTYVTVQFEGADCMKYVNDSAYDAFIVVRSDKTAGAVAYIDDISLCKYQPVAGKYKENFEAFEEGYTFPQTASIEGDLGLYWADAVKDSFTVSTELAKNGSKAGKIVSGAKYNDTGVWLTNSLVKRVVTTKETYVLSFWYYSTAATQLSVSYRSGTTKPLDGIKDKWWQDIKNGIQVNAREWTYVTVQFEGADCMKYVSDSAYAANVIIRSTKTAGAFAYIDDISLCSVNGFEADALTLSQNGNCDNGTENWFTWDFFGGTNAKVEAAEVDGNKCIKFSPDNSYSSVGFDLSPYIVKDSSMVSLGWCYDGFGAGYYTVSFRIKAIGLEEGKTRVMALGLVGNTLNNKVAYLNPISASGLEREISNEWTTVSSTFAVDDTFLSQAAKINGKYNITLRVDGNKRGYGDSLNNTFAPFDYYIDDLTIQYVKFDNVQPALGSSIMVSYKVPKTAIDKNCYVKFETANVEETVYPTEENEYVFTLKNISPKMLTENIKATLYAKDNTVLYVKESYSIAQYCNDLFDSGKADEKTKTLLADLLKYGECAQLYTGYNTENLPFSSLSDARKSYATASDPVLTSVTDKNYKVIENASVNIKSASVILTDAVACKFYFDVKPDEVKMVFGGNTYTRTEIGFDSAKNRYYAVFDEVPIYSMNEQFEITAYKDGAAASNTLLYSVESYAASKANNPSTPYLADLVKAMINYGTSSRNYKSGLTATQWISTEFVFSSTKEISEEYAPYVYADAVFSCNGAELTVPLFWDGGSTYKVRFAPTKTGMWNYKIVSRQNKVIGEASNYWMFDDTLDGLNGSFYVSAAEETAPEIYKHGFIKEDGKHFSYNDGTPFFYLGDTHWTMLLEEYDNRFKYIADKRAEQGFTVYQSQTITDSTTPLFDFTDRNVSLRDIEGMKTVDKYIDYIAQKGFVHANGCLFFEDAFRKADESGNTNLKNDYNYLKAITRHWVARYSAYPVIWTLAQEADSEKNEVYASNDNPWIKIARYINDYDAYSHPLTAHQETAEKITASNSLFTLAEKDGITTGHSFFGAQWKPSKLNGKTDFTPFKDYYASQKPAVMYESYYENYKTKAYGARVEGYTAYLTGMCGFGYGVSDIWHLLNDDDVNLKEQSNNDGFDTVTVDDKNTAYTESVKLGSQMTVMKNFFSKINWWELKPDFGDEYAFKPKANDYFVAARDENKTLFVVYLYSNIQQSGGYVTNLDTSATYTAKWFNPRDGYEQIINSSVRGDSFCVPEKPSQYDWVLILTKNS